MFLIPLREGSKGIPGKNFRKLGDRLLFEYPLNLITSLYPDMEICVATDSIIIKDILKSRYSNVNIFHRSNDSATDEAKIEKLIHEFILSRSTTQDEIIILIQATTPFLCKSDLEQLMRSIRKNEFRSCLSCCRLKRFIWSDTSPLSYDIGNKSRRQEYNGILVENGGFYSFFKSDFTFSGSILNKPIAIIETSPLSFFEIDEQIDWLIAEAIAEKGVSNFIRDDRN